MQSYVQLSKTSSSHLAITHFKNALKKAHKKAFIFACHSFLLICMIQSPELAAATNQTEKAILPLDQRPLAGQAKSIGEASFFEGWVHGPIIQVFKGPGRGYRKFDVLEKGEKVTLYKVKTSWVQISNKRIQSGWIRTADLPRIIDTNGYPLSLSKPK